MNVYRNQCDILSWAGALIAIWSDKVRIIDFIILHSFDVIRLNHDGSGIFNIKHYRALKSVRLARQLAN